MVLGGPMTALRLRVTGCIRSLAWSLQVELPNLIVHTSPLGIGRRLLHTSTMGSTTVP
jgi:hypothetical protein